MGSREDTREIRASSPHPLNADEEVKGLVERVCARHGGAKVLSGGAIDVCYSQIRKWIGDGSIPSLGQVLLLVQLAGPEDPFRTSLIAHLEHAFDPAPVDCEQVALAVEERLRGKRVSGAAAADIVREVFEEIAPGKWVRR